jgi:hypothetical protein
MKTTTPLKFWCPQFSTECLGDECTQKVPHVNKILLFFMEVIKQLTALNSITNIKHLTVYKMCICSATSLNISHHNRDTMKDY